MFFSTSSSIKDTNLNIYKTQNINELELKKEKLKDESIEFEEISGGPVCEKIQNLIKKLTKEGYLQKNLKVSVEPEYTISGHIILDLYASKERYSKIAWYKSHVIVTMTKKDTGKTIAKTKDVFFSSEEFDENLYTNSIAQNNARDQLLFYCEAHEAVFSGKLDENYAKQLQEAIQGGMCIFKRDEFTHWQRILVLGNKNEIHLPERIYRLVDTQGKKIWKPLDSYGNEIINFKVTDRLGGQHQPPPILQSDLFMLTLACASKEEFLKSNGHTKIDKFLDYVHNDLLLSDKKFKEIKAKFLLVDREGEPTKGYKKVMKWLQMLNKNGFIEPESFGKDYAEEDKTNKELLLKIKKTKEKILELEKNNNSSEIKNYQNDCQTLQNLTSKTNIKMFIILKKHFDEMRSNLYDWEIITEIESSLLRRKKLIVDLSKCENVSFRENINQMSLVTDAMASTLKSINEYKRMLK